MTSLRLERSRLLVLAALLLVAAAWVTVGERSNPVPASAAATGHTEHDGVVTLPEVSDSAVAPVIGATRAGDARLLALWILPGMVAALAALVQLRRLRLRPALMARVTLRGTVAGRAPPLAPIL